MDTKAATMLPVRFILQVPRVYDITSISYAFCGTSARLDQTALMQLHIYRAASMLHYSRRIQLHLILCLVFQCEKCFRQEFLNLNRGK